MIDWLRTIVSSQDFWINFSVAIIFVLAGKLSLIGGGLVRQIVASRQSYSVAGFWIGDCILPSYGGKYYVELWRIVQKGEDIRITFFAYSPTAPRVDQCAGRGVFRGGLLSAVYYTVGRESYESGVAALRLKSQRLSGSYLQFDVGSSDEPLHHSTGDYALYRVHLGFVSTLKAIAGIAPIQTFAMADAALQHARPRT